MPKEEYNKEWLIKVKLSIQASNSIIPAFELGDDDPEYILKIKEELWSIKSEIENLIFNLYEKIEKES